MVIKQLDTPPAFLPYRFDTGWVGRSVLKMTMGLDALMLIAIGKFLFLTFSLMSVVGCLIIMAMITFFGLKIYRNIEGSIGELRSDGVDIKPPVLMGFRANGPEGFFPIDQFRAVRIDRVSGGFNFSGNDIATTTYVPAHERVYLAGRPGTTDVLIARTQNKEQVFAKMMAKLLSLPFEDSRVRY